jgi:uncharacterized protein (TIGR02757 family)
MKRLRDDELKDFLDEKVAYYNRPIFIADDPVSIPHMFSKKEDIEIAAFLVATISWGQRKTILKNANTLLNWMGHSPYDFILNYSGKDLVPFKKFVHRTFNGEDCIYYLLALRKIYSEHRSIEVLVKSLSNENNCTDYKEVIHGWRNYFFSHSPPERTLKHFANPVSGSAAKRINMFLRWMIRSDNSGVDFGLWNMDPSLLTCPLDVHSGRVARKLGLLKRNQNDWQAATELTSMLKTFNANDPVKYDFALFGLGVYEKF